MCSDSSPIKQIDSILFNSCGSSLFSALWLGLQLVGGCADDLAPKDKFAPKDDKNRWSMVGVVALPSAQQNG